MSETEGQHLINRRLGVLNPNTEISRVHQLSNAGFVHKNKSTGVPPLEDRPLTEEEKQFAGHVPELLNE